MAHANSALIILRYGVGLAHVDVSCTPLHSDDTLGMVCIRTEDQLELVTSTTEAQRWAKLVLRLCLLL